MVLGVLQSMVRICSETRRIMYVINNSDTHLTLHTPQKSLKEHTILTMMLHTFPFPLNHPFRKISEDWERIDEVRSWKSCSDYSVTDRIDFFDDWGVFGVDVDGVGV